MKRSGDWAGCVSASREADPGAEARRARWLVVAAMLLTIVVHLPALPGEWIYDDYPYLVENADLRGGWDRVPELFTSSFPSRAPERGLYRPVTALSFRLDRAAGPRPIVSHGINLALAALLTLSVYALLRRMVGDTPASFATILFAAHPVHVEAFAWVTGRSEILAALGGATATILALDFARGRRSFAAAVLSGVLLLLAFLAKESAVVFLPLAMLLLASDGETRPGFGRAIAAPAIAIGVGLTVRFAVLGALGPSAGERVGPAGLIDRIPLVLGAAGEHLRLLVWPHPLSVERMVHPPASFTDPRVLGGVAALGIVAALVVALRRWPAARALAIWPLVAMLPVLHLIPIGEAVAERFLLTASIGACGLAGLGVTAVARRGSGAAVAILLVLGLAGSAAGTLRARDWRFETEFWRRETELSPGSPVAWTALGDSWVRRDFPDRAVDAYRRALALDPGRTVARLAMAGAWDKLGRADLAREQSAEAVRIDPDHPVALNNLGARLAREGDVSRAEELFLRAVEVSPRYAPALRNAAMAAAQRGDGAGARDLMERARRADPEAPGLDALADRIRALP